ncbi:MAG: Mur ligase domain-containing protein, partial [Prevotellaceae bacterium]|nr:Mur ligase domain-containing protein [Prevotellaceae bacterium]
MKPHIHTDSPLTVDPSPFSVPRSPSAVYFLGIGGIGMSALARYYKHAGAQVAGYDRTPSPLTAALEHEGMAIHYDDDVALIPPAFTASPENTLVIYTPALPAEHSELNYFKNNNYTLIKRSKALGHIAATKTTLAVAGTHGKSTITTLLAHLLTQVAGGCTAFLGGISKNYGSNLLLSDAPALVAEADEFDRSFLQLFPHIAVITATDADHLDIYGTAAEVKKAFADFAGQVKPGGALIIKLGVDLPQTASPGVGHVYRYALDQPCDFYADNIRRMDSGLLKFDLHLLDTVLRDCVLGVPGRMNVENAVAAAAAAYLYGLNGGLTDLSKGLTDLSEGLTDLSERLTDLTEGRSEVTERRSEVTERRSEATERHSEVSEEGSVLRSPASPQPQPHPPPHALRRGGKGKEGLEQTSLPLGEGWGGAVLLREALATFSGVQRRFDIQLHTPTCTYVDDYAHHPEELR